MNGAGIVRPETVREFEEVFGPANLTPGTLRAAYGLAEHCVYVVAPPPSGTTAKLLHLAREPLEAAGEVAVVAEGGAEARVMSLVSCGAPRDGVTVRIVDPSTLEEAGEGWAGEVWVQSPCVALGYFGHEEASERCFRAALRGLPLESAAGSGQPFGAAQGCAACNGVAFAARPHALQGASTGQPCVASSRVEREDGLQALCNLLGWRGGRRRECKVARPRSFGSACCSRGVPGL